MKLFLSWSGDTSKQVAHELRDWIPLILQNVRPFLSPADIEKGGKWQSEISKELNESNFGLICLTRENLKSQWLAFEAGALSKNIDGKAATLLLGINHSDVQFPLSMFQGSLFTKDDVLKLLKDINKSIEPDLRRPENQIDQLFDSLWNNLETKINLVIKSAESKTTDNPAVEKSAESISSEHIEELLVLARIQNRILSSPDELFKPILNQIDLILNNPERPTSNYQRTKYPTIDSIAKRQEKLAGLDEYIKSVLGQATIELLSDNKKNLRPKSPKNDEDEDSTTD
jgi:hypothetical protein